MMGEDIVFIADTHFGLVEPSNNIKSIAAKNTIDLIEKIDPSMIVLSGDIADLWVYFRSKKDALLAQKQIGPYRDYLRQYKGKILCTPGNTDDIQSPVDIERFHKMFGDKKYEIDFDFQRMYADPVKRLLVAHGHNIQKIVSDIITKRSLHGLPMQLQQGESLDPFTTDAAFLARADIHAGVETFSQTITHSILHVASTCAKSIPGVQEFAQTRIRHVLLDAGSALQQAGILLEKPTTSVFSHTHHPKIYNDGTVNTGTAGPQGKAKTATVLQLKGGTEPILWATYSPDNHDTAIDLSLLQKS